MLSVALQYGNAFLQGLQAAALKPADFFGNDDVLYLMEDMATGEIRLSILWEWLHKGAKFTEDDDAAGVKAGDVFKAAFFQRLLAEEYDKLQHRLTRYPTVMVMPGQPSTPEAMFNGFTFGQQATRAIDSGTPWSPPK